MDTPPSVDGLCREWFPLAMKYAKSWVDVYPRLRDEFNSAAAYALFKCARAVVTGGEERWLRDFPPLLKVAVRNTCLGVLRSERQHYPVGFERSGGSVFRLKDSRHLRPDEAAEEGERREQVERDIDRVAELLESLDPTDADMLLRFFIDGTAQAEMARERGVQTPAINKRIRRALEGLRPYFEERRCQTCSRQHH